MFQGLGFVVGVLRRSIALLLLSLLLSMTWESLKSSAQGAGAVTCDVMYDDLIHLKLKLPMANSKDRATPAISCSPPLL
jgi:hypothetical protein